MLLYNVYIFYDNCTVFNMDLSNNVTRTVCTCAGTKSSVRVAIIIGLYCSYYRIFKKMSTGVNLLDTDHRKACEFG